MHHSFPQQPSNSRANQPYRHDVEGQAWASTQACPTSAFSATGFTSQDHGQYSLPRHHLNSNITNNTNAMTTNAYSNGDPVDFSQATQQRGYALPGLPDLDPQSLQSTSFSGGPTVPEGSCEWMPTGPGTRREDPATPSWSQPILENPYREGDWDDFLATMRRAGRTESTHSPHFNASAHVLDSNTHGSLYSDRSIPPELKVMMPTYDPGSSSGGPSAHNWGFHDSHSLTNPNEIGSRAPTSLPVAFHTRPTGVTGWLFYGPDGSCTKPDGSFTTDYSQSTVVYFGRPCSVDAREALSQHLGRTTFRFGDNGEQSFYSTTQWYNTSYGPRPFCWRYTAARTKGAKRAAGTRRIDTMWTSWNIWKDVTNDILEQHTLFFPRGKSSVSFRREFVPATRVRNLSTTIDLILAFEHVELTST